MPWSRLVPPIEGTRRGTQRQNCGGSENRALSRAPPSFRTGCASAWSDSPEPHLRSHIARDTLHRLRDFGLDLLGAPLAGHLRFELAPHRQRPSRQRIARTIAHIFVVDRNTLGGLGKRKALFERQFDLLDLLAGITGKIHLAAENPLSQQPRARPSQNRYAERNIAHTDKRGLQPFIQAEGALDDKGFGIV